MDFHEIRFLIFVQKSIEQIQVSLKSEKNNGLKMKTYIHLRYFSETFWNEKCLRQKGVQYIKTQIL
jgi:hypothetical protein